MSDALNKQLPQASHCEGLRDDACLRAIRNITRIKVSKELVESMTVDEMVYLSIETGTIKNRDKYQR